MEKIYDYPDIEANIANLRRTVEFLTKIRPYRNYRNVRSLDKVADYINGNFSEYGLSTERQLFRANRREYANVIGTYRKDKTARIIVGAHYDVCGDQPGADDNASAVAGLLELARLISSYAHDSEYRFDFVAYSLEEPPFFGTEKMGSYIHAESMYDKNAHVRAMICLEMIGYFTTEKNSQEYPLLNLEFTYPSVGNFIAVVGNYSSGYLVDEVEKHLKTASIDVESLKASSMVTGVDFSDHRNYWGFGYDAVMITDTALYRNPNYHRRSDTIETLDFDKMGEAVKGVFRALINLE